MSDVTVVIPARYDSTRLPGKALAPLAGKPMVQHVWERAGQSAAARVVIATDDARIERAAIDFGAEVLMTSPAHASGTDRVAEVAGALDLAEDAIIVNVQGDEPLVPPAIIDQVATNLATYSEFSMSTLSIPLVAQALHDPSVVKVVSAANGRALYFSRATIPWYRDAFAVSRDSLPAESLLRRHVGIYAYRVAFLKTFVALGSCELEEAEALEQLRALYHGAQIHVAQACVPPGPDVNTPHDLEVVEALLLD
jgi:3-deoxy-manno-octulosonate cytidylyltransferase (CMP-KDO synthetase)